MSPGTYDRVEAVKKRCPGTSPKAKQEIKKLVEKWMEDGEDFDDAAAHLNAEKIVHYQWTTDTEDWTGEALMKYLGKTPQTTTEADEWDRERICRLINDLLIAGLTWPKVSAELKKQGVTVTRGKKTVKKNWTAAQAYDYYRRAPATMRLDKEDWPPKPKTGAHKAGLKKRATPKKTAPKKRTTKKKPTEQDLPRLNILKKKQALPKRVKSSFQIHTKEMPPASLSINMTDEGAKVNFSYKGEVTQVVQEVCAELFSMFNRLNNPEG